MTQSEDFRLVGKTRDKNVSWYLAELPELPPELRELLVKYAKVPEGDIEKHVLEVRDKAWEVQPFPCLGRFGFIDMSIGQSKYYEEVLERVKTGERLVDLGCCIGQDLRRVVFDGADSALMTGIDLRSEFFDLGYEMFRDADSFKGKFIATDILSGSNEHLVDLEGKISIIQASSIFHLFNLEDQLKVADTCVSLLQKKPGSMIIGRQVGNRNEPDVVEREGGYNVDRHSPLSWERFWTERVAQRTNTRWTVDVDAGQAAWWGKQDGSGPSAGDDERVILKFCVRML